MFLTTTEPIGKDWTTAQLHPHDDAPSHATAADVNERLARMKVNEIDDRIVPFLAAAAAEMALDAQIPWSFSTDDPPVAMLRLIAKVGMNHPLAGGPHTDCLVAQLTD